MKYATSDLHIGHTRIIDICPQTRAKYAIIPYRNSSRYVVDMMAESMILEWNEIAAPDDTVYILGDVGFCNPKKIATYLARMNGKKILVTGNHDMKSVLCKEFVEQFHEIHPYLETRISGHDFVMMHYPIFDWKNHHRGSIHLHGHRHGKPTDIDGRIMDVGLDATGKLLTSFDEIIDKMLGITPADHH